MIGLLAGIALSTLASEDLASIGAGLLARDGHLSLTYAVLACIVGVYVGDLGLWGAGFLLARRFKGPAFVTSQFERRLVTAILVSRFVPGSRLPMYVAMGAWGQRPAAFAVWSLVAVMAWTPLVVVATMYLGDLVVVHALTGVRTGLVATLSTALAVWGTTTLIGRGLARLARYHHQRLAHTMDTPTWLSTLGTFQRRIAEWASLSVVSGLTK